MNNKKSNEHENTVNLIQLYQSEAIQFTDWGVGQITEHVENCNECKQSCYYYCIQLSALYDNELEGDEIKDLLHHLGACDNCRTKLPERVEGARFSHKVGKSLRDSIQ